MHPARACSVMADEKLGWVTLHTSFMPRFLLPLPDGGALSREDVDGVAKDVRFPPDWRMAFEYMMAGNEASSEAGGEGGGGGAQGVMDFLPVELKHSW